MSSFNWLNRHNSFKIAAKNHVFNHFRVEFVLERVNFLRHFFGIVEWLNTNFGGMGTKYGYNEEIGMPYYREHFHEDDVDYEYVIFDDDSDMLLGQADNFIRVNPATGVTQADIDKAIKILNREEE